MGGNSQIPRVHPLSFYQLHMSVTYMAEWCLMFLGRSTWNCSHESFSFMYLKKVVLKCDLSFTRISVIVRGWACDRKGKFSSSYILT